MYAGYTVHLKIVIVNLMPTKIATETQLAQSAGKQPAAGGDDAGDDGFA